MSRKEPRYQVLKPSVESEDELDEIRGTTITVEENLEATWLDAKVGFVRNSKEAFFVKKIIPGKNESDDEATMAEYAIHHSLTTSNILYELNHALDNYYTYRDDNDQDNLELYYCFATVEGTGCLIKLYATTEKALIHLCEHGLDFIGTTTTTTNAKKFLQKGTKPRIGYPSNRHNKTIRRLIDRIDFWAKEYANRHRCRLYGQCLQNTTRQFGIRICHNCSSMILSKNILLNEDIIINISEGGSEDPDNLLFHPSNSLGEVVRDILSHRKQVTMLFETETHAQMWKKHLELENWNKAKQLQNGNVKLLPQRQGNDCLGNSKRPQPTGKNNNKRTPFNDDDRTTPKKQKTK